MFSYCNIKIARLRSLPLPLVDFGRTCNGSRSILFIVL